MKYYLTIHEMKSWHMLQHGCSVKESSHVGLYNVWFHWYGTSRIGTFIKAVNTRRHSMEHSPAEPILYLIWDSWESWRRVWEETDLFLHGLSMWFMGASWSQVVRSLTWQVASRRKKALECHICSIRLVKTCQKACPLKKREYTLPLSRNKAAWVY